MDIRLSREKIIEANIKTFSKLSPSKKIQYVEKAKKRLKYYRTLEITKKFLTSEGTNRR